MPLEMKYLKSAVFPRDFPPGDRPEVALAGRSNAGKSSFLNAIGKEAVARVSSEPGKTRLLNFFDVGHRYRIVDMPGYGFAARSNNEVQAWGRMIQEYLGLRENLVGLVILMDVRRDWTDEEEMLAQFLRERMLPFCLVATKVDKLTVKDQKSELARLKKQVGIESIFAVSNLKKQGTEDVENFIFKNWISSYRPGGPQSL